MSASQDYDEAISPDAEDKDESNEKPKNPVSVFETEQENLSQMTESYSEIYSNNADTSSVTTGPSGPLNFDASPGKSGPPRPLNIPVQPNRRHHKLPFNIDGHTRVEGDMTHYVANDLEFKIKLSSPVTKKGETPLLSSGGSSTAFLDKKSEDLHYLQVLNELEHESRCIAQSVDNLIENLSSILHSNSALTAENMNVYKDAVSKTCDAMDNNIRSMYTLLAKGEEVSQVMVPIQAQAGRIAEIKRLLQLFESHF